MTQPKHRLGVLISGRGSNMQAIASACQRQEIPAEVALVVSNRADAAGLRWARDNRLPCAVLPQRDYPDRAAHDRAIVEQLRAAEIEWICLAGYMRLLSPKLINAFANRILNIHPSLLPAFPGLHAQEQAWAWGVRVTGCTVHLVDEELDHGPIVAQRAVPVLEHDTADSLADRILVQEHQLYPEALKMVLTRPWQIEDRRLVWRG